MKKNKTFTLGDRMKRYEEVANYKLMTREPVIIRLDGRAFHTFTRGLNKPFDESFILCMSATLQYLCEEVGNCVFGYAQSDEITLVLVDYKTYNTMPWFDNRLQKLASTSAALATVMFNKMILGAASLRNKSALMPTFDARAFNVPREEVANMIIWRQQDATRNSVNSVAQANFSHKQLQGKSNAEMQEMLFSEKGINWNDYEPYLKRGYACYKTEEGWVVDYEMPLITQDREYVEKWLKEEEDFK